MRFLYRLLRKFSFILIFLLVAGAGGTLLPRPFSHLFSAHAEASGNGQVEILVLYNAIHTDIALPLNDETRARFGFLREPGADGLEIDNPQAGYIIFGWGGRSFYLETPRWSDLKPTPVFKAFTGDNSVMHVDLALRSLENSPSVMRLSMTPDGLTRMMNFIDASFARENGSVRRIEGKNYGRTDRFYEAAGYFNAFAGCTTWAAAALREAGIVTGLWNPLPLSLRTSLALYDAKT